MSTEPVARPHPEPIVLDIGGKLGALIVHWDASHVDTPIEISATGHDAERQHQHILERPFGERTFYAAVFDRLAEGTYTLWVDDDAVVRDVKLAGGDVAELRWTASRPG